MQLYTLVSGLTPTSGSPPLVGVINELPRRKQRGIKNTGYRSQESAYYALKQAASFPFRRDSNYGFLDSCR